MAGTSTTKIIVFGPTGKTGLAVLYTALKVDNVEVTIFIRSPHKLPADLRDRVTCVVGDIHDEQAVCDAIKGHDVVISSLGRGNNIFFATTVISEGTRNIVNGMRKHKVDKLIVVGVSFLLPHAKVKSIFFLKNVVDDHRRMFHYLQTEASDISWIGVMPPRILEKPYSPSDTYKSAVDALPGARFARTYDIADLIMSFAKDADKFASHKQQLVGISSEIPPPSMYDKWGVVGKLVYYGSVMSVTVLLISYLVKKIEL